MLRWALAFYSLYGLLCLGLVPTWLFVALAASAFLRYFNRWHECIHANQREAARWHPARALLILVGPIYLGRRELEDMHLAHHRLNGAPGDPDNPKMQPSLPRALLCCLFEPELSAWDELHRGGLRPALAARMLAHAAAWAGLMWLGGWTGLLAFNLTTRLANTFAWLVFSWVVHQPWLFGHLPPPVWPRPLLWFWLALVGRENYFVVRFHYLHHLFPSVPDRDLPGLSARAEAPATVPQAA